MLKWFETKSGSRYELLERATANGPAWFVRRVTGDGLPTARLGRLGSGEFVPLAYEPMITVGEPCALVWGQDVEPIEPDDDANQVVQMQTITSPVTSVGWSF